MTVYAIIAGGGTSGHVLPALAIAEALIDGGHETDEIVYFGAKRGIETSLVPTTGLRHEFFDVVGLKREFSPGAIVNNATFVPRMMRARRRAISYFREHMPRVVISVGGYASLPAVLAARACDVPIVVVSYDRRPGRSSQWASKRAAACAVAYPDSSLPHAVWTGAPVRRSIRRLDRSAQRAPARAKLGVPSDRFLVGVIGGSLGSRVLNDAVRSYARDHIADSGLAIRHVVGPRFYDEYVGNSTSGPTGLDYRVVAYEEDMEAMYAGIDLLVARGGAGTVAEVAAAGVPSILVPWAGAAEDHQLSNVKWLSDEGAAVLIEEADAEDQLGSTIDGLRADKGALDGLSRRARSMGERNRGTGIAVLIEDVAGRGRAG